MHEKKIENLDFEPKVSVCVFSYNQEGYIRECLEGIVNQKTSFKYEIIVHDDASTDGTAEIIREFQNKYPDLIIPILQKKNQYSINFHKPFINGWQAASGEFIALCEGDDYWIDDDKLQKQYDLIKHSDKDLCFTNGYKEKATGKRKVYFKRHSKLDHFPLSKIVRMGGGGMATASIMIRADILKNLPEWYMYAPVGDYFIQILGSAKGGALYLNDITAVYRTGAEGSWSVARSNMPESKIKNETDAYVQIFNKMRNTIISDADANFAIARELYIATQLCIKLKYYQLAKELIRTSWAHHKFITFRHTVLYCTRFVWG